MSSLIKRKSYLAALLIPFLFFACSQQGFSEINQDSLSTFLESGNFFYAALLSVVAGFLTALSPCVYPLIPITLGVIGARKYESLLQGFLVSLVYVFGMIALYAGLGILFAAIGVLFGGLFQSPFVLIAIGTLFVFFAISLLGVSNWLLPEQLLQRLSRIGGSGYRGAFLMGLVSGLIASPCTGPVLAFILTLISKSGDFVRGSMLMLFFGLGIGIPFLMLGTFSSLIIRIPKSGNWMNGIKAFLAVLMFITGGYYFVLGINGLSQKTITQGPDEWITIANNVDALEVLERHLKDAKTNQTPVIIDFFADWCVACHELDAKTFQDEKVAQILKRFKKIRVDLSTLSPSLNKLQEKYGVVGLPMLVFYDRFGTVSPRQLFGFIEPERFLAIIRVFVE